MEDVLGISKIVSILISHSSLSAFNLGDHLTYFILGSFIAIMEIFLHIPMEGNDGPQSQLKLEEGKKYA